MVLSIRELAGRRNMDRPMLCRLVCPHKYFITRNLQYNFGSELEKFLVHPHKNLPGIDKIIHFFIAFVSVIVDNFDRLAKKAGKH
jgi:hypothetical protein